MFWILIFPSLSFTNCKLLEPGLVPCKLNWVAAAGGISSFEDLDKLKKIGKGKVDFTVGSALDIFGGTMDFKKVCAYK